MSTTTETTSPARTADEHAEFHRLSGLGPMPSGLCRTCCPPEPAPMFALDEDAARAWLADPGDLLDDMSAWSNDEDPGAFPVAWDPREDEDHTSDVTHLLRRATEERVLRTSRPGASLAFVLDADATGYHWQALIPAVGVDPRDDVATVLDSLRLASTWEETRTLTGPELTGVDAAVAVLREAVDVGNALAARLAEHAAPKPAPGTRTLVLSDEAHALVVAALREHADTIAEEGMGDPISDEGAAETLRDLADRIDAA